MIVNSSRGGGSKDTWILDSGDRSELVDRADPAPLPPAMPDLGYGEGWVSQAQPQQQQRA